MRRKGMQFIGSNDLAKQIIVHKGTDPIRSTRLGVTVTLRRCFRWDNSTYYQKAFGYSRRQYLTGGLEMTGSLPSELQPFSRVRNTLMHIRPGWDKATVERYLSRMWALLVNERRLASLRKALDDSVTALHLPQEKLDELDTLNRNKCYDQMDEDDINRISIAIAQLQEQKRGVEHA